MRFFPYVHEFEDELFFKKPTSFDKYTPKNLLAYALGATLYMPATRQNIHKELIQKKHEGLSSMVICLEDAIGDFEVEAAENQLIQELTLLNEAIFSGAIHQSDLPLLFIRIRDYHQLTRLVCSLKETIHLLTGVVVPKFETETGLEILREVSKLNDQYGPFYAMPILETKSIIKKETRISELIQIKQLLSKFKNIILNVRIGATDFCGLYGIRRNPDTTIYEIAVVRDCIADILNLFTGADDPYVVSGPVWEYFSSKERLLKPQLRQTPFRERYGIEGVKWREELLHDYLDGFIREILMDISNGIVGKTIIHPSHIKPVQALNVVSYEEYMDAMSILNETDGQLGVKKSPFANKMNEIKPHYYWAQKIKLKSNIYGVLHEPYTFIDLLKAESFVQHT